MADRRCLKILREIQKQQNIQDGHPRHTTSPAYGMASKNYAKHYPAPKCWSNKRENAENKRSKISITWQPRHCVDAENTQLLFHQKWQTSLTNKKWWNGRSAGCCHIFGNSGICFGLGMHIGSRCLVNASHNAAALSIVPSWVCGCIYLNHISPPEHGHRHTRKQAPPYTVYGMTILAYTMKVSILLIVWSLQRSKGGFAALVPTRISRDPAT